MIRWAPAARIYVSRGARRLGMASHARRRRIAEKTPVIDSP